MTCLVIFVMQEGKTLKLTDEQIIQLLSAFWKQANLPDNFPANYEAIDHSYNLVLLSSNLKVNLA